MPAVSRISWLAGMSQVLRRDYIRLMTRNIKHLIMLYALRQSRRRTPRYCVRVEL
jgi:hypothetical protein